MKNKLRIFTILVTVLILSVCSKAFAASGSLSVSPSSVTVGKQFYVKVDVDNAAAWNVHVRSEGPVTNCTLDRVGDTGDESNQHNDFGINCTATAVGTITIKLSGDVSQANEDHSISKAYLNATKTVQVSEETTPAPTPSGGGNNNNNNNNNSNNNNKQEEKKSNDCSLSGLKVEGYSLVRVDDNNYTLEVKNDISSINVLATANNLKAKVEGAGVYELVEGENPITITVTAEDGTKNVINIVITRKEKEKEIIPIEPEKKEEPKKETKKKINITPKDYLIFGSLLLNVLLIVALVVLYLKHQKLLDSTKNMVVASSDFPFEYLSENEK